MSTELTVSDTTVSDTVCQALSTEGGVWNCALPTTPVWFAAR